MLKFMALHTAGAIQGFTGVLLVPWCIINQRITGVGMGMWWKKSFNDYHKRTLGHICHENEGNCVDRR